MIRVLLEISDEAHDEIKRRLIDCGAAELVQENGKVLDMYEISLVKHQPGRKI